jgi:hypothetical protein
MIGVYKVAKPQCLPGYGTSGIDCMLEYARVSSADARVVAWLRQLYPVGW